MSTYDTLNIDIHDLYKPLRNLLRKLDLLHLLNLIWASSKNLLGDSVVRLTDMKGGTTMFYLWELHILSRETLLHAPMSGGRRDLNVQDLLVLVSHVRRINEGISRRIIFSGDAASKSLHPLINQQARWHRPR